MSARIDIKQRECASCGHLCDHMGEFHPHLFCAMKRAGFLDPWETFRSTAAMLNVDLPKNPPLVRNLSQFTPTIRDREAAR